MTLGIGGIAQSFFISALGGSEWSASLSCRFTSQGKNPRYHWIEGWVGLIAGLDTIEKRKIFASAGNRTTVIQPVAHHCTD
jgi:hypothetical protein